MPYRLDVLNIPQADRGSFRVVKSYDSGITQPALENVWFALEAVFTPQPQEDDRFRQLVVTENGLAAEWLGLPTDFYRLYEYTDPRYAPADAQGVPWVFEGLVSDSASPYHGLAKYRYDTLVWISAIANQTVVLDVVNRGLNGRIELQKVVETRDTQGNVVPWSQRPALPADNFIFSIAGPNDYYEERGVDADGKLVFDDLPFGVYVITEIDSGAYINDMPSVTVVLPNAYTEPGGTVTVQNGQVRLAYSRPEPITNHVSEGTGSVSVRKEVYGRDGTDKRDDYMARGYSFQISIFGPNDPDRVYHRFELNAANGYAGGIDNMPYGHYVVRETGITGPQGEYIPLGSYNIAYYKVTDLGPDVSIGTGGFVIDGGENTEIALLVTNTEDFSVDLPAVGGPGVRAFRHAGLAAITLSLAALAVLRRKRMAQ